MTARRSREAPAKKGNARKPKTVVDAPLTAHKTVTMFMRYVHTEDGPVRAAADVVAFRRQGLIGGLWRLRSRLPRRSSRRP